MWPIYTMEYCSVLQKKDVLILATIQMNFKNMLNERSWTHLVGFHLYEMCSKGKPTGRGTWE